VEEGMKKKITKEGDGLGCRMNGGEGEWGRSRGGISRWWTGMPEQGGERGVNQGPTSLGVARTKSCFSPTTTRDYMRENFASDGSKVKKDSFILYRE
jgi:hypothetical protein